MPKSYEICLRLSAEEKERLEHSARTCGLSKTAYLRRLILGKLNCFKGSPRRHT